MQTCAIIAEYNPFHNGHEWQIKRARELGAKNIVVIMSGNYVQRGTPAVIPKGCRVSAALCCGADLVIELPVPYAISSAEQFCAAGVHLAASLGCVDTLLFGSEHDNIIDFIEIAKLLLSPKCDAAVKAQLQSGVSYAVARGLAAEYLRPGSAAILSEPNNILAVEYCKAIIKSGVNIMPMAIKRHAAMHHDEKATKEYASASFLRGITLDNWQGLVPARAQILYYAESIRGNSFDYSKFELCALSRLRCCTAQGLARLPGVSEGLENALYNSIQAATTLEEVYSGAKSKRYAHSRIRRVVLAAVLGITSAFPDLPPYIRVLGATENGFSLLGTAKDKITLPMSHSLANLEKEDVYCAAVAAAEVRAGDLYALCQKKPQPAGGEYKYQIIKA